MHNQFLVFIACLLCSTNCWLLLERYDETITVGDELALVASYPEDSNDFNDYSPVFCEEERPDKKLQPVDSILVIHLDDESIFTSIQLKKEVVVHENEFYVSIGQSFVLDDKFNDSNQVEIVLRYKNEVVSNKLLLKVEFKLKPEMLPTLTIFGAQPLPNSEYKFMRSERIAFGVSPPWMEHQEVEYYNIRLSIYGNDSRKVLEIFSKPHIFWSDKHHTSALIREWHIGNNLPGNRVMTARLSYQAIAKSTQWKKIVFDQECSVRFVVSSGGGTGKPLVDAKTDLKKTELKKIKEAEQRKTKELVVLNDNGPFDESLLKSLALGLSGCVSPFTLMPDDSHYRVAVLADKVPNAPKLVIANAPSSSSNDGHFYVGDKVILDVQFLSNPKAFNINNVSLEVSGANIKSVPIDLFNELPACWEWTRQIHLVDWVIPAVLNGAGSVQMSLRYEAQMSDKKREFLQSVVTLTIGQK